MFSNENIGPWDSNSEGKASPPKKRKQAVERVQFGNIANKSKLPLIPSKKHAITVSRSTEEKSHLKQWEQRLTMHSNRLLEQATKNPNLSNNRCQHQQHVSENPYRRIQDKRIRIQEKPFKVTSAELMVRKKS